MEVNTTYYKETGPDGVPRPFIESTYQNGNLDGRYRKWDKKGNLVLNCYFKYENYQSKLHGKYFKYYPDGKLFVECTYEMGKLIGLYKKFHNNGTLLKKAFYNNGKYTDSYFKWTYCGQLIERRLYGKTTLCQKFYENGEHKKSYSYYENEKKYYSEENMNTLFINTMESMN